MLTYTCPRVMVRACVLSAALLFSVVAHGQNGGDADTIKPVPILTGSTAYFTQVNGGEVSNTPTVTPVLLAPIGDKWLVEAKGFYTDTFGSRDVNYYNSNSSYGLAYAQVDYIANRFLTLTGGQFITPFGIYSERLAPNWIRALQASPFTYSITSGTGVGGMMRGGFPVATQKVNVNYALYYSASDTNHILATQRSTGGRMGFFLPGPRLEVGGSFQQTLQGRQRHAAGFHSEWQPNKLPLTVRSEYVHSSGVYGSGYWIESAYRLSQIRPLRRLELVGRGQQFYADPNLTPQLISRLDALGYYGVNTNQGDFGLNYYLGRDVRASASYGREFAVGDNANIWVVGITYRFLMPLGIKGGVF